MKIIYKNGVSKSFKEIFIGDFFEFCGYVYIKTSQIKALNIEKKEVFEFSEMNCCIALTAELLIVG